MMNTIDHDLLSMQEARILAENADVAQKQMLLLEQEILDRIIDRVAEEIEKYAQKLAVLSVEETGYGKWEDKLLKNRFASVYVRSALQNMKCVGIIARNQQAKTMDVGVPRGPIVALCPATSPVSTTIYKVLISIKSGNSVIFSLHPKAKKVMSYALDIMIRTAEESGLPRGAISYLRTVSGAGCRELMYHKATAMILITGVPPMLPQAAKSGKPVLYGGAGNGPAFVERTADLHQAVQDIVRSKTFDFGAVTAAEQSVVVDAPVSESVKREFQEAGAYFMTSTEADSLGRIIFQSNGMPNVEFVGKSATYLAKAAGFSIPKGTELLISEQKYVSEKNPYSKEKLCPVLAYYVEDDWLHACEKCIELLLNEKQGHTLVIHSRDEAVIEQFALKKPVARVLVNTPASFGGMGMTTNLFPAFTLGSGTVGMGITTDNISPMNLIYVRKVGYGVRTPEMVLKKTAVDDNVSELDQLKNTLKELLGRCHS